MTHEEEQACPLCGEEFTIHHFSELDPTFCPFCGESMYEDELEDSDYDWVDDEE